MHSLWEAEKKHDIKPCCDFHVNDIVATPNEGEKTTTSAFRSLFNGGVLNGKF